MEKKLIACLNQSPTVRALLDHGDDIKLPNWYIVGGVIPTVVWNVLSHHPPEKNIKDIDIVYFDDINRSEYSEQRRISYIKSRFSDLSCPIDIVNQARVHTWYRDKNGWQIPPYRSVEDAITKWLSVTAVGVRRLNGEITVFAPYGLEDLFAMRVRPNRQIISKAYYIKKTTRWKSQWPGIEIQDY